jgi:hypothetical protein
MMSEKMTPGDFQEHLMQKIGEQITFEIDTVMLPALAGAWVLVINVTGLDDAGLVQATGRTLRTVQRWRIGQTPQWKSRHVLVALALDACGEHLQVPIYGEPAIKPKEDGDAGREKADQA